MSLKLASLGSVSCGTLREDDLLEAFYSELDWQLQRQDRTPEDRDEIDKLHAVLGRCSDECWDADGSVVENSEIVSEYVNETLPDALSCFAPPYCYFGSHCGDGADFGYWPSIEAINELPQYDDADAAKDAGETNDFRVISDHGNVEIFAADGRSIIGIV